MTKEKKIAEGPYRRLLAEQGLLDENENPNLANDWGGRALSVFSSLSKNNAATALKQIHSYDAKPLSFDFLMLEISDSDKDIVQATDSIDRWPLNQEDKLGLLEMRAQAFEAQDLQVDAREIRQQFSLDENNPVSRAKTEIYLETDGKRQDLANFLKSVEQQLTDDTLRCAIASRRAELYSQVGWFSEAANAWEAVERYSSSSLRSSLGLVDASKRTQNSVRLIENLESMAKNPAPATMALGLLLDDCHESIGTK